MNPDNPNFRDLPGSFVYRKIVGNYEYDEEGQFFIGTAQVGGITLHFAGKDTKTLEANFKDNVNWYLGRE